MRETFIPKSFNDEHDRIIVHAVSLLEDMRRQGFDVTLRSLYYMFIAEDVWFPNTLQSYKRFGGIISDARLAGRIDWALMEDRARNVEKLATWDSPEEIMDAVASQYREDLWIGQEVRFHVRIEKDALIGVIRPICERWRVPFIACRGNTSQSEAYAAGKLFAEQLADGLTPIVLYLGDHDPSGIDMTRDNENRLSMFAGCDIEVRRLALNFDQVEEMRLPGNPAKMTDSRAGKYIEQFGHESWELDAIKPRTLSDIIGAEIEAGIDHEIWAERAEEEQANRDTLRAIVNRWDDVRDTFGGDSGEE